MVFCFNLDRFLILFHVNSDPHRAFNSTAQFFLGNWVAYRILNYPKQIAEWETRRWKRAKEANLAPKAHKLTEKFYVMRKEVLVPMFWKQNLSWNQSIETFIAVKKVSLYLYRTSTTSLGTGLPFRTVK